MSFTRLPPPLPPPLPATKADNASPSNSSDATIVADWANTEAGTQCFSSLWQSMGCHLTSEDPEQHSFTYIQGCQQIGPTCGLAALYMVAKHIGVDISSQQIFEQAVKKKMTAYGEMFDARNLSQLAQDVFGSKAQVILEKGDLQKEIPAALLQDHLILIPYDTDKNNDPCELDGKKAHWAILCGIIKTKSSTFVVARQSKSRLLSIWNFEKLFGSNSNLKVPDDKVRSGSVIPEEGLAVSLAKQCIIIKIKPGN